MTIIPGNLPDTSGATLKPPRADWACFPPAPPDTPKLRLSVAPITTPFSDSSGLPENVVTPGVRRGHENACNGLCSRYTRNALGRTVGLVVTIDGPAGAGKSTVARKLAVQLRLPYLDSGALYRAVALKVTRESIDPCDPQALASLMDRSDIRLEGPRVWLDGEDVSREIRTPEVTAAAKPIADSAVVRERLRPLQRACAAGGGLVAEGRDMGTVIFPEADVKFFLTADENERARRRHEEMVGAGMAIGLEDVLGSQQQRDASDRQRQLAPLAAAPDAIVVDSTHLSINEVVDRMKEHIGACGRS